MAIKLNRPRWWLQLAAAVVLMALLGGAAGWWQLRHWQPPRTLFAVQGVEIGRDDSGDRPDYGGGIDWRALRAIGADFAYLDASAGAFARDRSFSLNLANARAAGLQVGAVHRYDPCQPADQQAANFVTVVPRDGKMLPPAIELAQVTDNCPARVGDASVTSELMTFINEIEMHTGKAALLKITPEFERRYHLAHAIDRNLWLLGDRFQPDYAGRPWALWTANGALDNAAQKRPLRWIVVQP